MSIMFCLEAMLISFPLTFTSSTFFPQTLFFFIPSCIHIAHPTLTCGPLFHVCILLWRKEPTLCFLGSTLTSARCKAGRACAVSRGPLPMLRVSPCVGEVFSYMSISPWQRRRLRISSTPKPSFSLHLHNYSNINCGLKENLTTKYMCVSRWEEGGGEKDLLVLTDFTL